MKQLVIIGNSAAGIAASIEKSSDLHRESKMIKRILHLSILCLFLSLFFVSVAYCNSHQSFQGFENRLAVMTMIITIVIIILFFVMRDYLRGPIRIKSLNKLIKDNPNNAELYWKRGEAYRRFYYDCTEDVYGLAISDYSKAIELKPDFTKAYYGRALAYYNKREYSKSWQDVHKAEALGYKIGSKFLNKLKRASGS